MQSLHTLLSETIDYAGLFPPASLPMSAVVHNYAAYRASEHRWMLGRFVLPVARLAEFDTVAHPHLMMESDAGPWRLSALAGTDLDHDLNVIDTFNRCRSPDVVIDTLELKAASIEAIEQVSHLIPTSLEAYIEIPVRDDPTALIAAIAKHGMRAKVRTGGVKPDLFPSAHALLRFMEACVAEGVAFKATAGLHHAVRGDYRLTYEPQSATATMFGFLNVFVAAACVRAGMPREQTAQVLTETSLHAFHFDDAGIAWREYRLGNHQIMHARQHTMVAFGSCSFEEPIDDLKAFNLL